MNKDLGGAGSAPQRNTQVTEQVTNLNNLAETLIERVLNVRGRLASVLRSDSPSVREDGKSLPEPTLAALPTQLRETCNVLHTVRENLETILTLLEL